MNPSLNRLLSSKLTQLKTNLQAWSHQNHCLSYLALCKLVQITLAFGLTLPLVDSSAQSGVRVGSSLLLLIDASGSMGDQVGGGNPGVKIEVAKSAAIDALGRAVRSGSVEVAVLAFSGVCTNPVTQYQEFTRDVDRLITFIDGLQPGGGTPMADALLFANHFMENHGHAGASDKMIMLLADGQNDCGDVSLSLAELQNSGVIFRHETVGFGIIPNSQAAQDLREIATRTGGTYHHAADATQLADIFMDFVSTLSVIDLLGQFGKPNSHASLQKTNQQAMLGRFEPTTQERSDERHLNDLIGNFHVPAQDVASVNTSKRSQNIDSKSSVPPDDLRSLIGRFNTSSQSEPSPNTSSSYGALAIDSNQGPLWGWAINYDSLMAAERRALDECGEDCKIVMRFRNECAAFAADQTSGKTIYGWANGFDSGGDAQSRAMTECRDKGGKSCIVRVWGCTER